MWRLNPFHRVRCRPGDAHVVVTVARTRIAETHSPVVLSETGVPDRYYLTPDDVALELLRPSATTTRCPFKGRAGYWSACIHDVVVEDVAWSYPSPRRPAALVAGLLCFDPARATVVVDGVVTG